LQFLKEPEGMKLSLNAKNQIEKFVKLIEDFSKRKKSTKIGTLISEFIVESGYLTMLKESKEEKSRERLENISELVNIAMEMENESTDGSLITFLEHVALHSEADNGLDAHAVKLMTLHSAKGLEFPNVFLVGMEENMFPHKNSNDDAGIEEERRLCYVGITRAMKRLFITHARERTTWGKTEANLPSRFLYEFSEELIDPKFPLLKLEELTS
jgi:DNA helicase-2/ATP-dependent DNA helicase PcrA